MPIEPPTNSPAPAHPSAPWPRPVGACRGRPADPAGSAAHWWHCGAVGWRAAGPEAATAAWPRVPGDAAQRGDPRRRVPGPALHRVQALVHLVKPLRRLLWDGLVTGAPGVHLRDGCLHLPELGLDGGQRHPRSASSAVAWTGYALSTVKAELRQVQASVAQVDPGAPVTRPSQRRRRSGFTRWTSACTRWRAGPGTRPPRVTALEQRPREHVAKAAVAASGPAARHPTARNATSAPRTRRISRRPRHAPTGRGHGAWVRRCRRVLVGGSSGIRRGSSAG